MSAGNGSTPFNLDEARAAREEARSRPFPFTLAGEEFRILPVKAWTLDAQVDLAAGEMATMMPKVLVGGDDDFERLRSLGATILDIEDVVDAMSAENGLGGLPNSELPQPLDSTLT